MTASTQANKSSHRKLIIMAKSPVAGRVKTRLARDIGIAAATTFYRHTCQAVIARLSATTLWATELNIAPDTGIDDRFWPRHLPRSKQSRGDLGTRMRQAMTRARNGPVVLVGTDIPEIKQHHIAEAYAALRSHDVVLGPTPDGGYWLIGTANQRHLRNALHNVRWSTEFALQDTICSFKAQNAGLSIGLVARLNDIDHGDDFIPVRSLAGRRILPS